MNEATPLRMRPRVATLLLLLVLLVLAGCQSLNERLCQARADCELSPDDDAEPEVDPLIAYAVRVSDMPASQREAERTRLRQGINSGDCTVDHVRLGLVSRGLWPDSELADPYRAGLQACREQVEHHPVAGVLASMLLSSYNQQREDRRRYRELEGQLQEVRSRNQSLREQLDALKDIERSIIERN